jgi:hypothetical protein
MVGGRATATPVAVQGNEGLLESGPPAPQFTGVYWKPGAGELLSVVGYRVAASVVEQVAQHVAFTPPGSVSLPIAPGPMVTRPAAIAAARRLVHVLVATAEAKLSSWTEVTTVMGAGNNGAGAPAAAPSAVAAPWEPIWIVLLHATDRTVGHRTAVPMPELVVVAAATGQSALTEARGGPSWSGALTDRDPTLGGCPGGSRVRVPFGVLTRDEETYAVGAESVPSSRPGTTSMIVKLTTVAALDRADPGLYGGCLRQDCSLNELVWPTITVVRSLSGRTHACPIDSSPSGYRPPQVKEYTTITVAGSGETACGPVPHWVSQLKDLSPPATG